MKALELVGGQNMEAEPQTGTASFRSVSGPIWAHEEDTWLDFAKWGAVMCVFVGAPWKSGGGASNPWRRF